MIFSALLVTSTLLGNTAPTVACHPVDGDRIQIRDLAQADPRFAAADQEQNVGFSPQPGATRVFWPTELIRVAEHAGIPADEPFHQACFERRTVPLAPETIVAAIREWAPANASIEVLDQTKFRVPPGNLTLSRPQVYRLAEDKSVLIRGYIRFGETQRFPVWARIRVKARVRVIVPFTDIIAGLPIEAAQLHEEERDAGIDALQFAAAMDQVAGHVARRRILAGKPVSLDALEDSSPVMRGSLVKVEVVAGAAHLVLDGLAQRSGRTGEMVTVRNPSSGKEFLARVTGDNAVLVIPHSSNLQGTDRK